MISIIGAGPVGSYLAYLLAKKGEKVRIYEEHNRIGFPVQCTGLVTDSINKIIKVKDEVIVNKINKAKIVSPNGNFFEVKFNNPNLVLDRGAFDNELAKMAVDAGAELFLEHKFLGYDKKEKINLKFDKGEFICEKLIGADGSFSKVAEHSGLYGKRKFIFGAQARVKGEFNKELIEFYPSDKGFGWVVPENENIARIGYTSYKNAEKEFQKLTSLKSGMVLEYQSGFIPVYNPKIKTQRENVFLVGDAATQVKATTFGGLVTGLISAEELAKSFEDYEKNWRRRIGKELWLSVFLRNKLDKFSAKDYDKLIELFGKEKLKKIIESYDRDFPSKFFIKLILKEPRLLKFI